MSITPGRKTYLTLDTPVRAVQQDAWWLSLTGREISSGKKPGNSDIAFFESIGWRIAEYQSVISALHETDAADDSVYSLTVAPGVESHNIQRTHTELPGLGSVLTRSSGDSFYQKAVAAGDDWDARLSADETAFNKPDSSNENVSMDRIAISETNHRPDEAIWFRFTVWGGGERAIQKLTTLYFSGVPTYSHTDADPGTGQYALELYGDGTAILWERVGAANTGAWTLRANLNWSPPAQVIGYAHVVTIRSDAKVDADGNWSGSSLLFEFSAFAGPLSAIVSTILSFSSPRFQVYSTFQKANTQPTLVPLRADVRRDIRARLQLSKSKYKATGTIRTRTHGAPLEILEPDPLNPVPIKVTIFGDFPTGTSVDVTLYDATTNLACTLLSGGVTNGTSFLTKNFQAVPGHRHYYAVITLTASSDGFASPTLRRVWFVRDSILWDTAPAPVTVTRVTRVTVASQDADPTHETAGFTLVDLTQELDRLKARIEMGHRFEIAYDPNDRSLRSILSAGRLIRAKRHVRGPKQPRRGFSRTTNSDWPAPYWSTYTCLAVGEWYKLMETKAPKPFDFNSVGPDGIAPYKVTDAIKALLSVRYSEEELDIPDLPIRLFVLDKEQSSEFYVEPFTLVGPLIVKWAREYCGAFLLRDENANATADATDKSGMWRLKVPPRPPYTIKCKFLLGPVTPASGKVRAISPAAYPPDGSTPQTFIQKETYDTEPEAPEFNQLIVDGVGQQEGHGGVLSKPLPLRLRRVVTNWKAADFGQAGADHPLPDPTNSDYTDGTPKVAYYSDPSLTTQAAVDFVARRLWDMAGHARNLVRFQAPLVLITDAEDTLQARPRPLRFGDIVTIDDALFYISSVNIVLGPGHKDRQMAAYECISVPALVPSSDPTSSSNRLHTAIMGRMS